MSRLFHPLLYLLACATRQELARQVQYITTENEILRSKLPKRITVTAEERRRLVKVGSKLGSAIKDLITIVRPRTFARWASGEKDDTVKSAGAGNHTAPDSWRQLRVEELRREQGQRPVDGLVLFERRGGSVQRISGNEARSVFDRS